MTEKATIAILGTLESFRVTFLSVAGITFVLLAAAIFVFVQPRSLVRSAIEIGTVSLNGREEPIESPELLAKRIPAVYAPAALTALAQSGVPQSTLGALQNSWAESIGQTLSIQSTVDPTAVAEARAFQQKIIDQIVEEQGKRSDFLREAAALRTVLAKQTSDELDQQIADYGKVLDRLSGVIPETEGSLRARQSELGAALQHSATQLDRDDKAVPDIHGLREEVTGHLKLLEALNEDRAQSTSDLTALRARRDFLASSLLEAQIAAKAFKSTRLTLAPEVTSEPVAPRRLSLLFIAGTASILIAFAAITFFTASSSREPTASAASAGADNQSLRR